MTVNELMRVLRKMPKEAIIKVVVPDNACEMDIDSAHQYEDMESFETWCVLNGTWRDEE